MQSYSLGFVGISCSQYFQLQNFKTLLYQTGVHRLAIWQPIVPVMVTLISIILKLEKPTRARYVAIVMDLTMMAIVIILRFTLSKQPVLTPSVDEYGENGDHDKRYLIYILIVIMSNSV